MAQYTRTTVVDSGPAGDTTKQAVLDVDTDLTGIVAAYNVHDAATTSVHGFTGAKTGSGAMVGANTPTLITPVLGVATATSINKVAITAPATSATLTIADGKTLTCNESLTLAAHPVGGLSVATSANVVGSLAVGAATEILVGGGAGTVPVWTTATGSGAPVRATSPTLTTPLLGTPTSGALTNCTAYPITDLTAKTGDGAIATSELTGNTVITNTGAAGAINLTLPAGAADYSISFIVTVAQYLRVTANGTEKFRYYSTQGAAGGYIRDNVIGTAWRIIWTGSDWAIVNLVGTLKYDE